MTLIILFFLLLFLFPCFQRWFKRSLHCLHKGNVEYEVKKSTCQCCLGSPDDGHLVVSLPAVILNESAPLPNIFIVTFTFQSKYQIFTRIENYKTRIWQKKSYKKITNLSQRQLLQFYASANYSTGMFQNLINLGFEDREVNAEHPANI